MDKEFQQLVRDSEMGRRLADKLVRVHTRDGGPLMVLAHIEVQGQYERNFPERLYVYNYRIYDKYRCPVVSLAVLTDENPRWRPTSFGYKRWGFRPEIEFPMTKLLDYNDMAMLENNPNPFALEKSREKIIAIAINDAPSCKDKDGKEQKKQAQNMTEDCHPIFRLNT